MILQPAHKHGLPAEARRVYSHIVGYMLQQRFAVYKAWCSSHWPCLTGLSRDTRRCHPASAAAARSLKHQTRFCNRVNNTALMHVYLRVSECQISHAWCRVLWKNQPGELKCNDLCHQVHQFLSASRLTLHST
jgi:hypothetical protein